MDEYDQPIRELLMDLILANPKGGMIDGLKQAYTNYFGFFKQCKGISSILPFAKIWLTGNTLLLL